MMQTFIKFRQTDIKFSISTSVFSAVYIFDIKVLFHHQISQQNNDCTHELIKKKVLQQRTLFYKCACAIHLKINVHDDFLWQC